MAIKKATTGKTNGAAAQKLFTDREEPQESFIQALANINNKDYSVLTYYGVGGIGKSSLQKHLKKHHLDKDEDSIYSWVDFDIEANRTTHKTLRILAQNFKSKFKIKFPIFDIAYFVYWSKAFPDHDIKKDSLPFLEEGSLLFQAVDTFSEAGGIAGAVLDALDYVFKKSKEFSFDDDIKYELKNLNNLESDEAEEKLAIFFARDIEKYKEKNPDKKVVIFFDTYEALWQINRSESNRYSQDEWVRYIIEQLENVLIVICGRESIKWKNVDSDWEKYLNQHILGGLDPKDARFFLRSCSIEEEEIQNKIIESSEGLPYYLDLCVDTFYRIKNNGNTPTVKDFKNVSKDKIFERFMRYLDRPEQETLKILANARFYTKELFSSLIEEFNTAYPVTAMNQLNSFSFISEDNGSFFIHDLMRRSLLSFQDKKLQQDVNTFLFKVYNKGLQELNIKSASQDIIEALPEAFYHKTKIINSIEELDMWYKKIYEEFYKAAKYKTLIEPTLMLSDLLEKTREDKLIAVNCYRLGELYKSVGKYEEALRFIRRSLEISKKAFGKNDISTAAAYNNLAGLYESMGKYEEALPLYKKSLTIREKTLGEEHPNTATSYGSLAGLYYKSMGKYEEAVALFAKYFKVIDFTMQDDMTWFIYPYVKWHQCTVHLGDDKALEKLERLGEKLIALYKEKLGNRYIEVIEKEYNVYFMLKNSDNEIDREKYEMFVKIFWGEN